MVLDIDEFQQLLIGVVSFVPLAVVPS